MSLPRAAINLFIVAMLVYMPKGIRGSAANEPKLSRAAGDIFHRIAAILLHIRTTTPNEYVGTG